MVGVPSPGSHQSLHSDFGISTASTRMQCTGHFQSSNSGNAHNPTADTSVQFPFYRRKKMRQRVNTVFLFLVGKKKMKDFCSANLNLNTDSGVIVFLLT